MHIIILECIKKQIALQLREEQAGRRPLRFYAVYIILRHVIEESVEWQAPLVINFIDFQKAFDSIHSESLWTMTYYGISAKIIRIIKNLYDNAKS